jgi:hypothetical protein
VILGIGYIHSEFQELTFHVLLGVHGIVLAALAEKQTRLKIVSRSLTPILHSTMDHQASQKSVNLQIESQQFKMETTS